MLRSASGGSGSARLSPRGSVPPLSRGCGSPLGEWPLALRAAGTAAAGTPGSGSGTDPPGRSGLCLCLPDPGERQRFGLFLGLSLGTARACVCVCQELLSELLLEVLSLQRPNGISCGWSHSGQQYPMALKQPEKSPLPSQILGLSDLPRAPHEVPLPGCHRKRIKETDSAYVRLAKQGGRPDLLRHYTPVVMKSPPAAYAAPDWFTHCASPAGIEKPREFVAGDHHGKSYERRRGPFEFDTKNVWQREAEDKENAEKKKVKLPPISPKYPSRMPTVSTKEFSGENKLSLPPMPAQRKIEAVNFSKLISNGYGSDWLQQCTGWEKKIEETSENSEHSEDSEHSESPPASNELKATVSGM